MIKKSSEYKRFSGVLLHPTSLPSDTICGGFGKESREWLKLLAKGGIGVWQFLPLSPTDSTGSPYSSPSSFALNTWFLNADDLVNDGYLLPEEVINLPGNQSENKSSFDTFELANKRSRKLGEALRHSWEYQPPERHADFKTWAEKQFWLEDHALFMQIRHENNELPWWKWPSEFSFYNKRTLNIYKEKKKESLLEHYLLQWHLYRQWNQLRELSQNLGVLLFGDLPFYVSRDSVDVWSNRSLFSILSNGNLYQQSGVPPDYFSETGQLWGNPVYRWERHHASNFRWWKRRFDRHFEQVDLLRIDHFRAFKACWKVSGKAETAMNGIWSPSPGLKILSLIKKKYGNNLPLVAEDLGVITEDVDRLRIYFNLPGMKILQFAFDGNPDNPYLPENIDNYKSIVYTGTHDNPTTVGWWEGLNDEIKNRVKHHIIGAINKPSWGLIEIGLLSKACLFIAPIQDILSLNDNARLNTPGTLTGNWSWRLNSFDNFVIESVMDYGTLSAKHGRGFEDVSILLKE